MTLLGGFGHCAYGSKLFHDELNKNNIKNQLLVVRNIKDNNYTLPMKRTIGSLLEGVSNDDELFGGIKQGYVKRGNSLPKNAGHAVVLIGETVWDITSEQFGLENTYPLADLFKRWGYVKVSDITLSNDKLAFYVNEIKAKDEPVTSDYFLATEGVRPRFMEW